MKNTNLSQFARYDKEQILDLQPWFRNLLAAFNDLVESKESEFAFLVLNLKSQSMYNAVTGAC